MSASHLNELTLEINIPEHTSSGYAVLAVHGRNQDPAFMKDILKRLNWNDLPAILPQASNKTWYPNGFMANVEDNQPDLDNALLVVKNCHKRLNALGYPNERIILLGFSQGACLISQYALLNPDRYKSVVVFTGGYIGQENVDWGFTGDFKETPVYISTSEIDEWVPSKRTKETAAIFDALNAEVELQIFSERVHEVSDEEIEKVKGYLR